jgi:hypothetical protein
VNTGCIGDNAMGFGLKWQVTHSEVTKHNSGSNSKSSTGFVLTNIFKQANYPFLETLFSKLLKH